LPTYEYRCDSCAENFDAVQGFHDEPLAVCPTCGSPVRKVFGNVGIVFKGSGFYKTDSRNGTGSKSRDGDSTSAASASSDTSSSDPPSGSPDKGSATTRPDPAGSRGTSPSAPSTPTPADKPAGKNTSKGKETATPA
jgi:putative FmdB family regulatory protein